MLYVANAFSISMLANNDVVARIREITLDDVKSIISNNSNFTSCVGHQGTADVLSLLLGTNVPCNRVAIKLEQNDELIVFQLSTRLEEGRVLTADELIRLPHKFYIVQLLPDYTLEALYHW